MPSKNSNSKDLTNKTTTRFNWIVIFKATVKNIEHETLEVHFNGLLKAILNYQT